MSELTCKSCVGTGLTLFGDPCPCNMSKPLSDKKAKYIALDVETGGIGTDKSLLSAYFMALDNNLEFVSELLLLTKPDDGIYTVTAEALRINGINLIEHEKVAVTVTEGSQKLYDFLSQINPTGKIKLIPIGHNVAFDIKFIHAKLLKEGTWNKFVAYGGALDTGVIASYLKRTGVIPESVKGSLSSLAEHYKIDNRGAHDAVVDVHMTVEVLRKMLNNESED